MKIAIMTQPLGKNYGGIMQAFALQIFLKKHGHQAVTLNRQNQKSSLLYNFAQISHRSLMKILGRRPAPIFLERYFSTIFENTFRFISKHIKTTKPLYTTKDLEVHFKHHSYDAVIVGSDQTWRPRYSPNIYNFFLDFPIQDDIRRIAYASSFGVNIWEYTTKESKHCSELVKKFHAISVRESSGVRLCRDHLGVDAEVVLDPTLLLTQEDYLKIVGEHEKEKLNSGILTYWLDSDIEKIAWSNHLARELGIDVYSSQANLGLNNLKSCVIDDYRMPSVEDWLSSFIRASYVLTDSFHGMVFAIIFKKPFYVVSNINRGSARFTSLLVDLGLEDRLIESIEKIDLIRMRKSIDYDLVETKLSLMRNRSINFITTALRK